MRTTSSSCPCSRRIDEKKDGTVPIDMLLKRDERTVYSGEVYYSTDFGAGVRLGAARRWLNQQGHKADVKTEYSERLQEVGMHYGIPRPAATNDPTISASAIATRPRMSVARADSSSPPRARRNAGMASRDAGSEISARRLRARPGQGQPRVRHSKLLFAEATLSRRRVNDTLTPRKGYVWTSACDSPAMRCSRIPTSRRLGKDHMAPSSGRHGRFKLRGEVGAMTVGNFDALPPDLRFYAGGDRSIRGFDYHEIGEQRARQRHRRQVPGVASAEYEYYFTEDWGAAVFADAGDAFIDTST